MLHKTVSVFKAKEQASAYKQFNSSALHIGVGTTSVYHCSKFGPSSNSGANDYLWFHCLGCFCSEFKCQSRVVLA